MIPLNIKKNLLVSLSLVSLSLGALSYSAGAIAEEMLETEAATPQISKEVNLINGEGEEIGTVMLTETENGVTLHIKAQNMPTGTNSFHIHETAACNISDFKSAGGHLNPDDKQHGFNAEGGPHAGDLPNIHINEQGEVNAEVFNDRITLSAEVEGRINLLDEDGSSIMIHENPDDYTSQPTGGGGARIACAEIK